MPVPHLMSGHLAHITYLSYIYERYMREVHVKCNLDAHFETILNLLNR